MFGGSSFGERIHFLFVLIAWRSSAIFNISHQVSGSRRRLLLHHSVQHRQQIPSEGVLSVRRQQPHQRLELLRQRVEAFLDRCFSDLNLHGFFALDPRYAWHILIHLHAFCRMSQTAAPAFGAAPAAAPAFGSTSFGVCS